MIHPQVFFALQEGIDVLTPRSRLVRELGAAYEVEQSRSVFSRPRIFVTLEWIKRQLSPMLQQQGIMLCDPAATALLWEDALAQIPVTAKHVVGLDIFAADEERMQQKLIHQAQQAWQLIHLYDISWKRRDYSNFALPCFFYQWASLYQQICKEKKVMDEWQAVVEFNRAVYEDSIRPPKSLWVGWSEYPPLYEKTIQILGAVRMADTAPLFQPIVGITRKCRRYPDEKQELLALAQRVQMEYDADKQQTIGVVIPDLERSWHKLRQIFRAAFRVAALGEEERAPFDMSWGERLESHPVIGDLLNILALSSGSQPILDLLQIFQTAYIRGATEEQTDRCALNNRLIELSARQTHLNVKASLYHKTCSPFAQCPRLMQILQDFYQVPGAFKSQDSPCHWAQVFSRQAETLRWGAVDNWSSQEIYLQDRWARILDELYAMHRVLPRCTRARALSFLKRSAQALFQPYRGNKQIRILGIREADGLSFDRLFICQINENAVPRPPANFFIPYRLGQAAQVPGYGIESNGRAERRLVEHLLNAAPIVELSYAAWIGGEEQLIHPQLRRIEPRQTQNLSHTAAAKFILEEQDDFISPRVMAAKPVKSIVQLIKEQAACPFKSFSRFRLNIKKQPQLIEQLSAQERGAILHDALHQIWRRLSTQRRLKAMRTDKLGDLITTTVKKLIKGYAKRNIFLRQEIIAEVEQQYFVDLVTQALEYDRSRQPSFRIYALEEKRMLKDFCGYDFSLRIDRIDEIDGNGGLMVLDYKSPASAFSTRSLKGERPDEPQLLVYSLLIPTNLTSVGFFLLSLRRGVKSTGISLVDENIPDYDLVSLQELMKMRQRLKDLFNDFLQGNAEVDPKSTQTCHYCHYHPLCRINASR